jgi:NAD(P)-dependent dehydrogenase (short-subunit alcohol dehydrogenase family)
MAFLMPSKASLTAATTSNALYKPKTRPVAVFLGGTSGIGQAMAEQLARQTNGRARIVIMGRNQVAADKIISGFPKTSTSTPMDEASDYSFIKVDATSMAQIREVATNLSKELDKINFIVTTAGFVTLKGRDETSEGLDRKMACNFYARFRLIQGLMPLVEKAAEMGERTGVVNVFAPGRGGPITTEDLGLVKTYSLRNSAHHAIAYNDVAFEVSLSSIPSESFSDYIQKFAQLLPNVGFYHIFPGAVTTPMTTSFPGAKLVMPLFRWMTVTPNESAQVRRIFLNAASVPLTDPVSTDHVVEGLERRDRLEEGVT